MEPIQNLYNSSMDPQIRDGPNWTSPLLTSSHLPEIAVNHSCTVSSVTNPCGQFNRGISVELKELLDNDMALPFECVSSVSEPTDIYCDTINSTAAPEALVVNTNNSSVGDDFDINEWFADSTVCSKSTLCNSNNYASSHSLLSTSSADITSTSCFTALEEDDPFTVDIDISDDTSVAKKDNFCDIVNCCDDLPLPILELNEDIISPDSNEAVFLDQLLNEVEEVKCPPVKPIGTRKRPLTIDLEKCRSAKRAPIPEPSTADINTLDQLIGFILPNESDEAVVSSTTPPCDVIKEINWKETHPAAPAIRNKSVSGSLYRDDIEREKRRRNNEASRRSRAIKKNKFLQKEREIDFLMIENKRMERALVELDKAHNFAKQLIVNRISTR